MKGIIEANGTEGGLDGRKPVQFKKYTTTYSHPSVYSDDEEG